MTGEASGAKGQMSRILAGTDGSERAMEAVRQAAMLAAAVRAGLLLVHVIDTGRTTDVDVDVEREADETLEAASAIARSLEVVPDARVLSGDPSVALLGFAEEQASTWCASAPMPACWEARSGSAGSRSMCFANRVARS